MLESFRKASDWVAESGGDVFPTFASFQWFIRKHRQELVGSRQYLPRRGSAGSLIGPGFEQLVVNILTRECLEAEGRHDVAA
ncbi:MAG: hypothetical protein RJQ10_18195 [Haliea sp.]|uniref:hypothetical protein n=1 Tax=Haliea sp. TaxID=1932666 RepID=UPI0032EEBF2F